MFDTSEFKVLTLIEGIGTKEEVPERKYKGEYIQEENRDVNYPIFNLGERRIIAVL